MPAAVCAALDKPVRRLVQLGLHDGTGFRYIRGIAAGWISRGAYQHAVAAVLVQY